MPNNKLKPLSGIHYFLFINIPFASFRNLGKYLQCGLKVYLSSTVWPQSKLFLLSGRSFVLYGPTSIARSWTVPTPNLRAL